MIGTQSLIPDQIPAAGLIPMSPPVGNAFQRIGAKLRLASVLRAPAPPPDESLLPFYVETLASPNTEPALRARICRALLYHGADTRRYVPQWIPYYVEAVCAYSDDPRCVLFVLSLLYYGAIDAGADLAFAQGVYCAALFFESWEGTKERVAWGLPGYGELRRYLAALYVADPQVIAPERTELAELVYNDLTTRVDTEPFAAEINDLANYLSAAMGISPAAVRRIVGRYSGDPLDDPELILRGGSGNPDDDLRIAHRYVDEERPLDAAACALFARCLRYAESEYDEEQTNYWRGKLAFALIAMDRVDEDTRDILQSAALHQPDTAVLELAAVYAAARNGASNAFNSEPEAAFRLEQVVMDKNNVYKPICDRKHWDWNLLERALALSWGHRGRTDGAARALYKSATEANPDDRMLAVLYARALATAEIFDKYTIPVYERAVEMGKGSEAVLRALALAYVQNNTARNAEKCGAVVHLWEEMYRSGSLKDNGEMIAALSAVYAETGSDSDVALALMENSAASDPQNGMLRLRIAREKREQNDPDAAILFKEAAKLLPQSFDAQYETGTLLRERSEEELAVRYLKKAVALPAGARNADAHYALAQALIATEKRDDAKIVLEKIIGTIDADYQPALLTLATVHLRYEESGVKRAEVLLEKAVSLNPDDANAYKRLALLHEEQGRFADAEAALEQYLALSSPDAAITRKLAALYLKRGDFIKAESAIRQTVALGGGDKKLFAQLGDVIQKAQQQRNGAVPVGANKFVPVPEPKVAAPKTPPVATVSPYIADMLEEAAVLPVQPPAPEVTPAPTRRQSLITQNSGATPANGASPAPGADSPAAQNLTRSVGAAAIKAALRSRAARLTQSTTDKDGA
ncbi:MAG: hypothetical protein H7Y38_10035 [Armatimonadetes bacterium]|nr:hypothetical protein [Armatimonadota bacterium]